jgi:hypothetical protein
MNAFSPYSIPVKGLKVGFHSFHFVVDGAFFALFEDSPIGDSSLEFKVELDRRSDMLLFDFEYRGMSGSNVTVALPTSICRSKMTGN